MSDFSIVKGTTFNEESSGGAIINVTVNITIDKDAPPALARAVAEAVGSILALSLPEAMCEEIGRDLQEISERKKREVDHVAAQLLGELGELGDGEA